MHPNRTLLLAVTGMSPAIITETLYGIDRNGDEWPKEIQVITTSKGKDKIYEGLITNKHLDNLCQELRKPKIPFSDAHILVVPDAQGLPVEDARSLEDHEALANFIMTTVRDATTNDATRIHASIAGGRKTMTFYLGYAMSLFGRHFDKLSHVLVSEGFESCPEFFYPTREDHTVISHAKKELNAKDAEVTLADIPFIRQRSLMPDLIKRVEGTINFRHLVDLINLGEQPEAIALHIYPTQQQLVVKSRYSQQNLATVNFKNLLHWSLYLLILEDTLCAPDEREEYTAPRKGERDDAFGLALLFKLGELKKIEVRGDSFEGVANNLFIELELDGPAGLRRTLESFGTEENKNKGFTARHFSTYLNAIKEELAAELPTNLVQQLMPQQMDQNLTDEELSIRNDKKKSGANSSRQKTATGQKGGQPYILHLPDPQLQIIIHNETQ